MAAKKDKAARRLARKRKAQRRQALSGQQVLLKRVQASEDLKHTKIIQNPGDAEKMSDVILRFAEPLQDEYGIVEPDMIRFAILVWNASLLPQEAQNKAIEDLTKLVPSFDREARQVILSTANMLLERKEQYFSDNKRFIMDYHIRETSRRIHL